MFFKTRKSSKAQVTTSQALRHLFDEHKDAGHFTVDQAVEELEERVLSGRKSPDSLP